MAVHGFGCLPSSVDLRDYILDKSIVNSVELPEEYIIKYNHNVKNQGSVSSCAAHAVAEVIEYYNPGHKMSTNFIYGTKKLLYYSLDEGMMLRDACKTVTKYGDMVEIDCKGNTEVDDVYTIAEEAFNDKIKMDYAYRFKIKKYVKLRTDEDIKFFIKKYGPVVASITWYYDYKFDNDTGLIYRTDPTRFLSDRHAVVIYGWDKDSWFCQNSWGVSWGNKGLFRLKYTDGHNEVYGLIDDASLSSDIAVINPTYNISILDKILKFINFIISKI